MSGFCFFFCKGGGKRPVLVLLRERSGFGLRLAKRGGVGREVVCREDDVVAEEKEKNQRGRGAAASSRSGEREEKVLDEGGCLG